MQQLITQSQIPVGQRFDKPFRFDLIKVSSQDAQFSGVGDYVFNFKQNPISDGKTIQLYSYSFPLSWTNITTFTNTIVFSEGAGANITTTIPVGQYTVYDLQTALASAMTTAVGATQTYTVTFSTVTSMLTISAPTTAFTIHLTGTTLSFRLGLTANITSSGVSNSLTFQSMIDLLPSKYLTIKLPGMINTCDSDNSSDQSTIGVINLSGYNFGDTIKEQESGVELKLAKKDLSSITISIIDQLGYTPDMDTAQVWEMVFRVSHIN